MSVSIRTAEPSDFNAWFELFELVAAEGLWVGAETPLPREHMQKQFERSLRRESEATFLAEADGLLVGRLNAEDQWGCAELGMMVRDGHRGQGIGSALMDAFLDWARQRGCHKIVLDVFPHNAAAIALYRKYGFAIEGRQIRRWPRANGERWDSFLMGLVLDMDAPGSPHPDAPLG